MPSFTPYNGGPALEGTPTVVARYLPGVGYQALPTVRWTEISYRRGPQPATAAFRFAHPADAAATVRFEDVIPAVSLSLSPDVVRLDDRLVVLTVDPLGAPLVLFDGFVQIPEASVSGESYALPFQAQGAEIRCWDSPLQGSRRRDAYRPQWIEDDLQTSLPARFNPRGRPNCTMDPFDTFDYDRVWSSTTPTQKYPVFFDDLYPEDLDKHSVQPYVRYWTVGAAARYILAEGNGYQTWCLNPNFTLVENTLRAAVPNAGNTAYVLQPIACPDLTVSGMPWPEALDQLLRPHGFTFTFRVGTLGGLPYHYLTFERERDSLGSTYKDFGLQPAGETVESTRTNVGGFSLARDGSQIVNRYSVSLSPDEYEVGIILSPGFRLEDTDFDNAAQFTSTNADPLADRDKYRLFIADECGEGHWSYTAADWVETTFTDFAKLWGGEWTVRRRPGETPLFSRDLAGNPHKATLCLLTGYTGPAPALLDGTDVEGELFPIKGSWELLEDRLGVRLTNQDPTKFNVGTETIDLLQAIRAATAGSTSEKLAAVSYFVLTCVVQADRVPVARSRRRASSPSGYDVWRDVDGRDRYKRQWLHKSSFYAPTSPVSLYGDHVDDPRSRYAVRDDTAAAQAYADSLRNATDAPSTGGIVRVPRLTDYYQVGDRVLGLTGRMSLASNVASEPGELTRYPMIVQATFRQSGDRQESLFYLDDRRAAGEPVEV